MNKAAIAVLLAAGVTAFAIAQTSPQSSTAATGTVIDAPKTETESPLVRAARQAKANRKIPTKVITNKDVKNSKGKLAVTSPKPLPPDAVEKPDADKRSSLEKQDAQYVARKAAEKQTSAAEKKVAELEKDLAAIEQAYYEEKDLNRRDDVIQKRYAQARRQLEQARKELADARDAAAAVTPQPKP